MDVPKNDESGKPVYCEEVPYELIAVIEQTLRGFIAHQLTVTGNFLHYRMKLAALKGIVARYSIAVFHDKDSVKLVAEVKIPHELVCYIAKKGRLWKYISKAIEKAEKKREVTRLLADKAKQIEEELKKIEQELEQMPAEEQDVEVPDNVDFSSTRKYIGMD